MNHTVFYSWQSDLKNAFNRSFIQDALEKAVKNISQDKLLSIEAVVDRDTYGIPGSPSIVESITGKIAKSDVFVCDISIVNSTSEGRQTPNPNVLFELGYASSVLGWDRIILVQNTAFGGPEKLPFDLRGRRILPYHIDASTEGKTEVKQKLKQRLIDAFQNAFKYYINRFVDSKEKAIWWGIWVMNSARKAAGGTLSINKVSSDAFFFNIEIYDGARSGNISGKAQITAPHSAYSRIFVSETENCELIFRRRSDSASWYIEIDEGLKCWGFHGMGAYFTGTYIHQVEPVIDYGYLDEIDIIEIERITGKHLTVFLANFQQINHEEGEYGDQLKVITAGVKGLYTIMESIVVLDTYGAVWCACLDPEQSIVRYFTNVVDETIVRPKPLEEWLSRFSDRRLIINKNAPETIIEKDLEQPNN